VIFTNVFLDTVAWLTRKRQPGYFCFELFNKFLLTQISIGLLLSNIGLATSHAARSIYHGLDNPTEEVQSISEAEKRLQAAIKNPEYLLNHWIELPTSPESSHKKLHYLHLREAILLALRYNPNIRNAELDRIIQRYQLRLAYNEFELQYALAGSAAIEKKSL
jgi:hypothetical protein